MVVADLFHKARQVALDVFDGIADGYAAEAPVGGRGQLVGQGSVKEAEFAIMRNEQDVCGVCCKEFREGTGVQDYEVAGCRSRGAQNGTRSRASPDGRRCCGQRI